MWAWWKKLKRFLAGENALHQAVEYGDIPAIKNLLHDGFNIETYDQLGYTPLQYSLLHRQYLVTLFLLEQGADPNAICYSKLSKIKGKPIQSYLHVGRREPEHYEFPPLMQRNKSLITLLILYGTSEESVVFYENQPAASLFKQIFRQSQQFAQEKREQEWRVKEGLPQIKYDACQRLSNLWRQLSEAEPVEYDQDIPVSERLHDILKAHYAEKAKFYANQVQQLIVELKKISTEKKVAVSHKGSQACAHDHPAHLYLSPSRAAQAEKVPLLQDVAQTTAPVVASLSKKLN